MAQKNRGVPHLPPFDFVVLLDVAAQVPTSPELPADGAHHQFVNPLLRLILAGEQVPHFNEHTAVLAVHTSRFMLSLLRGSPKQSVAHGAFVL